MDTKVVDQFEGLSKDQKKVETAYNKAMKNCIKVLNGNKFKPVNSIPNDGMAAVMNDFFKEEVEDKIKEFKTGFKELLSEKVKFDNFVKQQKQQFNKIVFEKKKEFTAKATKVLQIVQDADKLKEDYAAALNEVSEPLPDVNNESSNNSDETIE